MFQKLNMLLRRLANSLSSGTAQIHMYKKES